MVETLRNKAINPIAVGGNDRATKPAAANLASWKRYRDTKRRYQTVTLKSSYQSNLTYVDTAGETTNILRREKTSERAMTNTFWNSDLKHCSDLLWRKTTNIALRLTDSKIPTLILAPAAIAVGAGV